MSEHRRAAIDLGRPYWRDYAGWLQELGGRTIPGPGRLNRLLPAGVRSGGGAPLRFLPAKAIGGVDYERHVFETGEVSTREDNWHDLFNALVWCRLPCLKAALNGLHYRHLGDAREGRRGPARDAATLLDESGALVASRSRTLLESLARRDWQQAFVGLRDCWQQDTRVVICGHALLEKCLAPYKSLTAQVLLLHLDELPGASESAEFLPRLDRAAAMRLQAPGAFESPDALAPLPLMGVPGWWPAGDQDTAFYADRSVFRPPPEGLRPAPVHPVEA